MPCYKPHVKKRHGNEVFLKTLLQKLTLLSKSTFIIEIYSELHLYIQNKEKFQMPMLIWYWLQWNKTKKYQKNIMKILILQVVN